MRAARRWILTKLLRYSAYFLSSSVRFDCWLLLLYSLATRTRLSECRITTSTQKCRAVAGLSLSDGNRHRKLQKASKFVCCAFAICATCAATNLKQRAPIAERFDVRRHFACEQRECLRFRERSVDRHHDCRQEAKVSGFGLALDTFTFVFCVCSRVVGIERWTVIRWSLSSSRERTGVRLRRRASASSRTTTTAMTQSRAAASLRPPSTLPRFPTISARRAPTAPSARRCRRRRKRLRRRRRCRRRPASTIDWRAR